MKYIGNKSVLFHSFKHNLRANIKWIYSNRRLWNESILNDIKSIGNSQLDYYTGNYSEDEIKKEVILELHKKDIFSDIHYLAWLNLNGGYQLITLNDSSEWILRYLSKEQFIHIYPSRYSPDTVRIKANTLKTILCIFLFENAEDSEFDYEKINFYRKNKLSLSPIDKRKSHSEIFQTYNYFVKISKTGIFNDI